MVFAAKRVVAFLALFLLQNRVPPAEAAPWPISRGPSHELAPFYYVPAQWKAVPKSFLEDASACTLYSGLTNLIDEDGTIETITHEITRFNGRKGIDKLGEYRNISFDPTFQVATLNEARVIKADGRMVAIEPQHVQLRDVSTDYQVYDHDKQLVISFPNLEVGDSIEVKWTVRGKNPEHQGQFFARYNFGADRYPVVLDEMSVRLPKSRTLQYAAVGGLLQPTIHDEGKWRTYQWQVKNRSELSQDENLPSHEELRLEIACSTFLSWDEVGRWKHKLRADCWECSSDVREVVQTVTKNLKSAAEKASVLTQWVRRHIRYVSLGEKHDFTPHLPSMVLMTRYGDCKDQSQLLAVMLREAGINVALATLGTLGDGQVVREVPSPWGTHAILLVRIEGLDHWIDTTISSAPWDFLPHDDRNRLCYVVDGRGLRLVRTPSMSSDANRTEQTTVLNIGADGSSQCHRVCKYVGLAAVSKREEWIEAAPGERRRIVASDLQNTYTRAHLRRLIIDDHNLLDFEQPLNAILEFGIPDHFHGEALPEGSLTDSVVWNKLLTYNVDYDRQTTMELPNPFESTHHYLIHLAPAFLPESLPKEKKIVSAWGTFAVQVQGHEKDKHSLEVTFRTSLKKVRVEPTDFEAFRKFQEDITQAYRVWLTLKPTQDLNDAAMLEALLAYFPTDNISATVLAQLYQQNGKSREAGCVLRRALSYSPDKKSLWELLVKVAKDLKKEDEVFRDMMQRFPNENKYVVELGEALLDRGDYAGARKILEGPSKKAAPSHRGLADYCLARCDVLEKKWKEAFLHFESAAKADREIVVTLVALQLKGHILEHLGRPSEAITAYRQAFALSPESPEPLEALVNLTRTTNSQNEALSYLRRFTVVIGHDGAGLSKAAAFYLDLGRYEDALDLALQAREQGRTKSVNRVLGLVYFKQQKYALAVPNLSNAEPDAQVLDALIRSRISLGNLEKGEQTASRIDLVEQPSLSLYKAYALTMALAARRAVIDRDNFKPMGNLSHWKNSLDHFVCAEHAYLEGRSSDQVVSLLNPAFAEGVAPGAAFALRGLMALERGRLSKALVDATRAVDLSPQEPRGYFVRGRVRFERREAGALPDLKRAVDLSQQHDAAMLHWLATAYLQAGQTAEAASMEKRALQIRPEDKEIRDQLRQVEAILNKKSASR